MWLFSYFFKHWLISRLRSQISRQQRVLRSLPREVISALSIAYDALLGGLQSIALFLTKSGWSDACFSDGREWLHWSSVAS